MDTVNFEGLSINVDSSLDDLVPHVFLPLQVSSKNIVDQEPKLLLLVANAIDQVAFSSELEVLKNIRKTFQQWELLQAQENMDAGSVNTAIKKLNPGDDFALYIRQQNAGLVLTILGDENHNVNGTDGIPNGGDNISKKYAVFSTFPASQPMGLVTSAEGDLGSIYPTTSITITSSTVLESECFAIQLSTLNNNQARQAMPCVFKSEQATAEVRDVANPTLVAQWLSTLLVDENSKQSSRREIPRIIKKIRDRVVLDTYSTIPFRRSGLWMTIKVVLQLCLVRQLGDTDGKFLYKLIILKVMISLLQRTTQGANMKPSLQHNVIHAMQKVARRTLKLQIYSTSKKLKKCQLQLFQDISGESARTLQKIRTSLKSQWEDNIKDTTKTNVVSITGKLDTCHSLKHNGLNEFLGSGIISMFENVAKLNIPIPVVPKRHCLDHIKYPLKMFMDCNESYEHLGTVLYDFESNVFNWGNIIELNDCDYVWKIFQHYVDLGRIYYSRQSKDPIGLSRMILVCLKVIKELDVLVTSAYPMLKEHRPGIDLSFTTMLVLPGRASMYQLVMLEEYFRQREQAAKLPSLIEEEQILTHSFSARYGKQDAIMQHFKAQILRLSRIEQENTLRKLEAVREKSARLLTEIRSLECEYQYNEWKRYHSRACKKCGLVNLEKKCIVHVCEKSLPVNEEAQDAVMFELMLPRPIGCLRDLLFIFGSSVTSYITVHENELYGPWVLNKDLLLFNKNRQQEPFKVSLMSSCKLFLESHYNSHHATNPNSDFIVNCGYNLRLAGNGKSFEHTKPPANSKQNFVKSHCTFKVEKKTPYSSMQWAINGGEATYNQVLARQNECHRDLPLVEFVEFGSLRASQFIQLRNLFRALAQMTLSLKTESVYSLICQTLTQTGTNTICENFYRDTHQEFLNDSFTIEFLTLMEDLRRKHAHNWKDHYVLLSIIQFTLRTIALTNDDHVLDTAFTLLGRCREMAMKWSTEIRRLQSNSFDAPRSEIDTLRLKMIEVNTCCALTFSVDPHHYIRLDNDATILTWLLAMTNIYDNRILFGSGHTVQKGALQEFPKSLQNLLRRVHETGLNLESFLHKKLNESSQLLNTFVESYYDKPDYFERQKIDKKTIKWQQYPTADKIYYSELYPQNFTISIVTVFQVDIIGGSFLVDGCPVSYLPSNIENHPEFQRIFPMRSFEVRPYPFQPGRFITRDMFLGSQYSFFLKDGNTLVVTEHRSSNGSSETLELIPSRLMDANIPHLLVEGCSHWWNKKSKVVEFFRRDDNRAHKLYDTKPRYMLYLGKDTDRYIVDLAFRADRIESLERSRSLVDINAPAYSKIVDIIKRLEHWKFVNIWCNKVGRVEKYIVELPRLNLQFEVAIRRRNGIPVLTSKEYRGMKVAENQDIGTLIGLRNGLLLEDGDRNCKAKMPNLLLMPHGTTVIKGNHNLEIQTKKLRTPAFFAYEVDERLRQLKARESQSAWLFLAYLHAATSSSLPDPFTQVTGTERAFQILQSGHCWSCQPLDEESLITLNNLCALAPIRSYYPITQKTIETVRWQASMYGDKLASLVPQVAHDGFQIIAQKLLKDSERLNFLFSHNASDDPRTAEERIDAVAFRSNDELCVKSYWQRVGLSTNEGLISAEFDETFDLKNAPQIQPLPTNSAFYITFTGERMSQTLRISQLTQKWKYNAPNTALKLVQKLLLTSEDLKGVLVGDGDGYQKNEDWRLWSEMGFRENWIDLYNFARKAESSDMKIEWTMLLTMLCFRSDDAVSYDHLLFLHTVAVNHEKFQDESPPPHIEYFKTNEYNFNSEDIMATLKTCAVPWEQYMDVRTHEMRQDEEVENFISRMRPVYESEIEDEARILTRKLQTFWPVDSCDNIPAFNVDPDLRDAIGLEEARKSVNITLKNWHHNMELQSFLQRVETLVEALKVPNEKYYQAKELGKQLLKCGSTQSISEYFKQGVQTVNLIDILAKRDCAQLDQRSFDMAVSLFNNKVRKEANCEDSPNSKVHTNKAEFPLKTRSQCPILGTYMTELKDSWNSLGRTPDVYIYNTAKDYEYWSENLGSNRVKANEMWEKVKSLVKPIGTDCDNVTKALISAELFPRVIPLTLLPMICKKFQSEYLNYIKMLLGGYAVLVTNEQRSARCLRYSLRGKDRAASQRELELERENIGHENWNPSLRPHWLLFEIEMDIMIRKIQAKVAERMENPVMSKNALLQLNMGEGKTAVIVPLLILSLANGSQLCRVTVLKSLYEINQKALVSTLGGLLLNRRVYTFPCRRDYSMGGEEVGIIFEAYQECMAKCGVVIALPENRLSFRLKMYEKCGAENLIDGREFLKVQQWLETYARDILDESDEILHVKYQLIYTIGKQHPIGGGSTRWIVLQKLLKLIPGHLRSLNWKYLKSIEVTDRPEPQFPFCRLLKPDCIDELCTLLAQDVINGNSGIRIPQIRAAKKETVMKFLTTPIIDRDTINRTYEFFKLEVHREILLILRGLLACGVINTALSKRWRVNYGVNPSGYRRVAVPFRAKDVAAERTEFGHPDIAICLTQLSYYYSGLSDEEILQSFMLLFKQPDPTTEYNSWIALVPTHLDGFETIKSLAGVNLKDFHQRTNILFPAFRFNTATVDFWLSNVVFPQESKQFAWKIGCSPWDLCAETKLPTTGFSGTNDSKLLLPKTITQNDLPELLGTNGLVLKNLLKSENNKYEALGAGLSGEEILRKLVKNQIRVLLDVGALMLELNNEQVAQTWLKLEEEDYVDAAIYFDANNKLVVTDRLMKQPVSLELSTYRTRLDRCVIYLDDVHTRGTDLKIPPSTKGCVTLGKGVTKDKLVQGCMRMRKLGHGHTVVFWASSEVDGAIRSMVQSDVTNIGSKEVMEWSIENSRAAIEDGFMHWANAGVYQAQKLSSHYLFNVSKQTDADLKLLADSCSLKETTDLKAMYGEVKSFQPFPVLVQFLLKRVKREMEKRLRKSGKEIKLNVESIVTSFGEAVVAHTSKYVQQIVRSTQTTDEEQERELEHELEAEQEKELPPKYKPNLHDIHPLVERFIVHGDMHGVENWAVKLPLALYKTTIWKQCKVDTWGQHIYATHEFQNVIKSECKNDVLRPVQWFCTLASLGQDEQGQRSKEERTIVLLISPYEANYFIDAIRLRQTKVSLHMYASRLAPDQKILCDNPFLMLPVPSRSSKNLCPLTLNMQASLLLFSGASYFSCKEEQDEYCQIVGFSLHDRNEAEKKVYEEGGILDGFFVKPEYRVQLGITRCQFQENPEALIRGIIRARFGNFSADSHVGKMIHLCKKPFPGPSTSNELALCCEPAAMSAASQPAVMPGTMIIMEPVQNDTLLPVLPVCSL